MLLLTNENGGEHVITLTLSSMAPPRCMATKRYKQTHTHTQTWYTYPGRRSRRRECGSPGDLDWGPVRTGASMSSPSPNGRKEMAGHWPQRTTVTRNVGAFGPESINIKHVNNLLWKCNHTTQQPKLINSQSPKEQ